jgi:anti-sigma factor RsiW
MTMNCKLVECKLDSYLDGELNGIEMAQIKSHIAQCPACATDLQKLRNVKQLLGSMFAPEPSYGFEERLKSAVFVPKELKRRENLWVIALGTCCTTAILGFAYLRLSGAGATQKTQRDNLAKTEYKRELKDVIIGDNVMGSGFSTARIASSSVRNDH